MYFLIKDLYASVAALIFLPAVTIHICAKSDAKVKDKIGVYLMYLAAAIFMLISLLY